MRVGRVAAVGGLVIALGFLFLFEPAFAASLGLEFTFVTLLGVLAAVQSLRFVQRRRRTPRRATETADPERRYEAPTPGDEVDETLSRATSWDRYSRTLRGKLRSRATDAAVAAVTEREGCTEDEARRRVEAGAWTDDPVAAWFVGDEVDLPIGVRARLLLSRRSRVVIGFDRTVRAVTTAVGDGPEGER